MYEAGFHLLCYAWHAPAAAGCCTSCPLICTPPGLCSQGHDYDVSGVFATNPREAPGAGGGLPQHPCMTVPSYILLVLLCVAACHNTPLNSDSVTQLLCHACRLGVFK